jgi:hypothetical protein
MYSLILSGIKRGGVIAVIRWISQACTFKSISLPKIQLLPALRIENQLFAWYIEDNILKIKVKH